MKYLVKPFWIVVAIIHLILKICGAILLFFISLLWNLSLTDAIVDVIEEFQYFYTSSICRGAIIIYRYKTMKDFIDGSKIDKHKFL